MSKLDTLFQTVQAAVKEQYEQDKWERIAKENFDSLIQELFEQVKSLIAPLEQRLQDYPSDTVTRVWAIQETENELAIQFRDKQLAFKAVKADARQESDRYTVQIYRQNNQLVTRFDLSSSPLQKPKICVLSQAALEPVSQNHIVDLLVQELIG